MLFALVGYLKCCSFASPGGSQPWLPSAGSNEQSGLAREACSHGSRFLVLAKHRIGARDMKGSNMFKQTNCRDHKDMFFDQERMKGRMREGRNEEKKEE